MKKILLLLFVLSQILYLGGCSNNATKAGTVENKAFMTIVDDAGRKVAIPVKPERVVSLSPSFFGMIDAVGGKIVGKASSRVGVIPDSMKEVPEVGVSYNVDIEKVIALKPDCVFALKGQQDKLIPLFESNNIPVIVIEVKTYKEVQDKLKLFSRVYGDPERGDQEVKKLDNELAGIVKRGPKDGKKIVILHASAKNVTVELEETIAGSAANLLGFKNVAGGSVPLSGSPDKTPYSLEELVKNDPEIIFITSMGKGEAVENRLRNDVKSNPAWNSLRAVREDKVFFLPEQLFLINPGLRYPEAVRYMAETVYPEVFNNAK